MHGSVYGTIVEGYFSWEYWMVGYFLSWNFRIWGETNSGPIQASLSKPIGGLQRTMTRSRKI